MRLEVDARADAAYVVLDDAAVRTTHKKDEQRLLDFDEYGELVGIELLNISQGVDLRGLPFRSQLTDLLRAHGVRTSA
jgi:uncharacterized protein YuzE